MGDGDAADTESSGAADAAADASEGRPGHEELARDMGSQADDMAHRSAELQENVDSTRSEWERRQADESVPGAVSETADPTYRTPAAAGKDGDADTESDADGPETGDGQRREG